MLVLGSSHIRLEIDEFPLEVEMKVHVPTHVLRTDQRPALHTRHGFHPSCSVPAGHVDGVEERSLESGSWCERQLNGDGRPDTKLTGDLDGAVLQVDEPLDAGEPEAGARVLLSKSAALELQEDRTKVAFVDSAALVDDTQHTHILDLFTDEGDLALGG